MNDLNKPDVSQPDYDRKRNLKRYGGMSGQVFCLDADVASLEAENERLREALMRLFQANSTASSAVTLIAALEHAKAILNREHEKL